jgi:hypothetical protein
MMPVTEHSLIPMTPYVYASTGIAIALVFVSLIALVIRFTR